MDRRSRAGPQALPVRNRVRDLRSERGWSQTELGERLGVSRQTVNAIENERYDPSLPLAFVIARVFALPIEEIFIGKK
jgi:putative transcriptional regulator